MILENKWYEADTVQDSGFFTDLQSRSREKIVWFPKIYYQMEKGLLHIRCEITLGKYQDQLLRLEDKLESGLYCELTDKTLHDGYIEYTLLYDMIANRITIDEVRAENGCLKLMKNLVWEYDALPHALIAGYMPLPDPTGQGNRNRVRRIQTRLGCANPLLDHMDVSV